MEVAVGSANWLLGKVLTKLSDGSVAAYVASLELGHNFQEIRRKLMYTQGLLHAAQGRDVSHNLGLQGLLQELSKKADEAEDVLDELHYFIIQDQLDGTDEAAVQDPGPGIRAALRDHARHGRHAARYTVGNWLPCCSCSPTKDDDSAVISAVTCSNPRNTTNSGSDNVGGHADKLPFNRVEMSMKIKSVIQDIHALCDLISNLLDKIPINSTTAPLTRPHIGSTIIQDTLYGRRATFEKTIDDITTCTDQGEALSVLPVVGPGGIGKTTFTQHLYNDPRTKDRFTVRVWVCVSTEFNALKLTQQILGCILEAEKEGSNTAYVTTNLDQLQNSIAQRLKSKRFLIVLDDIWKFNIDSDWKTLLAPLTKGEVKGSMVVVTTRFPYIANMVKTTGPIELQGLESDDFLKFFESCIFGEHKPSHYEDDLSGVASEIAKKLKGSPLAAQTVGRLLKRNLSPEHWNGVLQNSEWQNQQNNDDIIPSLKISYDYLPFDLKKCFPYCALFPEDYRFNSLEINRLWIALGIIGSSQGGDKNLLEELVENGFLMKKGDDCDQYYIMHDLMHELCRIVSAHECLNINCLNFRADALPQSIRHLSITMEDRNDEKFVEEMDKLKRRIDIANLRTLMIFRGYNERIVGILKDVFKELNGLRVLFIVVKSLDTWPHNFSKLIHLQYLKIRSSPYGDREMTLPSTLSRFYHLKFLDLLGWNGSSSLPKDINRLVNLHNFLASEELHSNVREVGKMKYLRELKQFCVRKERDGFELRELGELGELGGELSIRNLENVATKGEASDAKLMLKSNLKKLKLVWGGERRSIDADVLDGLQPHPNLRALVIENLGGTTGPSWLCLDIGVKNLETLHLEDVSWSTLPPFELLPRLKELTLERISGLRQFGPDYGAGKCFMHLKKVILSSMPELVEWVVKPNCRSFPRLESIECSNCPNLRVMPLSEYSCTNLDRLHIKKCPSLSLPPMPHTSTLRRFVVCKEDYSETLVYSGNSLVVKSAYNGDLAFHNLDKLGTLSIAHISLADLEKLKSLRNLNVERCESMFSEGVDGSVVFRTVETLRIGDSHLTAELLSRVFNCFPALSEFKIDSSSEDHGEQVIQFPSSSSLQRLEIWGRESLVLVPAEDGGGIQRGISSLRSLVIWDCGKLLCRWPMGEAGGAQAIKPFPSSLRELYIGGESSLQSMALLSNLTSLTHLLLNNCTNLTIDGFDPLMAANLKELEVVNDREEDEDIPDSIGADLLSEVARSITRMPAGSFQLQELLVDSISAVLVAPICNLLASTLHTLRFCYDHRTESLTEEQEKALQLLTSLQELQFHNCEGLQSLPQGLHRLSSLKRLEFYRCDKLRCLLPKDGFPTSLQALRILRCSAELKDQVEELKATNPKFRVEYY